MSKTKRIIRKKIDFTGNGKMLLTIGITSLAISFFCKFLMFPVNNGNTPERILLAIASKVCFFGGLIFLYLYLKYMNKKYEREKTTKNN
jgi:hypothetical protein